MVSIATIDIRGITILTVNSIILEATLAKGIATILGMIGIASEVFFMPIAPVSEPFYASLAPYFCAINSLKVIILMTYKVAVLTYPYAIITVSITIACYY
jgi:hypothetical protein